MKMTWLQIQFVFIFVSANSQAKSGRTAAECQLTLARWCLLTFVEMVPSPFLSNISKAPLKACSSSGLSLSAILNKSKKRLVLPSKILTVSTYFCWNGTILVFVKHIKGFFKGWQFIRSQFVCHFEQEQQETGPAGSLKKQRKKNIN